MTFYLCRKVGVHSWEMSKWEGDHKGPSEVYQINGSKCWCPSFKPRCKHLDILDEFKKQPFDGAGLAYDYEAKEFTEIFGL